MSEYLSQLCTVEKTDEIGVLSAPLLYQSDKYGLVEVKAGFETDYASVPRLPIIYSLYGDRAHKSAVLHDYAYRIDSVPAFTFSQANDLFLEAMLCCGHKAYVAYPMYWGVVIGGYFSYHKRKVGDKL
jgi:hypothetical protein